MWVVTVFSHFIALLNRNNALSPIKCTDLVNRFDDEHVAEVGSQNSLTSALFAAGSPHAGQERGFFSLGNYIPSSPLFPPPPTPPNSLANAVNFEGNIWGTEFVSKPKRLSRTVSEAGLVERGEVVDLTAVDDLQSIYAASIGDDGRGRNIGGTAPNPPENWRELVAEALKHPSLTWVGAAHEVGAGGLYHLQIVIKANQPISIKVLRKLFKFPIHFFRCTGTFKQNWDYINKGKDCISLSFVLIICNPCR